MKIRNLASTIMVTVTLIFLFSNELTAAEHERITLANGTDIRTAYGLNAYSGLNYQNIKIAVLDQEFDGFTTDPDHAKHELYLPAALTRLFQLGVPANVRMPDRVAFNQTKHGIHMAQAIRGVCGFPANGPHIRFYDVSRPEMFLEAVGAVNNPHADSILSWGAHIVVNSNNWAATGNFDGTGPLNDAIAEATSRGVIWINNAGNYGALVSNHVLQPIAQQGGFRARLPDQSIPNQDFTTFYNNVAENEVSITLAWKSDPGPNLNVGTNQDLDLFLYKETARGSNRPDLSRPFRSSERRQVRDNPGNVPGGTLFSEEQISARLPVGKYFIAVRSINPPSRFGANEKFRITLQRVSGNYIHPQTNRSIESLIYHHASRDGEIQTGGDGTGLTIGNFSKYSARGPTLDGRGKPEILLEQEKAEFTDRREIFIGNSYTNAIFAGMAATYTAAALGGTPSRRLTQQHLKSFRIAAPGKPYWTRVEGWSFDNAMFYSFGHSHVTLNSSLRTALGVDNLGIKNVPTGTAIGSLVPLTAFTAYSSLSETVRRDLRNDPDSHEIFLYTHSTSTTRTVVQEPLVETTPRTWIETSPARSENRTVQVLRTEFRQSDGRTILTVTGHRVQRNGTLGPRETVHFLPGSQGDWFGWHENVTQTVTIPARGYWREATSRSIARAPRTVTDRSSPELRFWSRPRNSTTRPPTVEGEPPAVMVKYLQPPQTDYLAADGRPRVTDGSNDHPKIFNPPTPAQLRAAVNR